MPEYTPFILFSHRQSTSCPWHSESSRSLKLTQSPNKYHSSSWTILLRNKIKKWFLDNLFISFFKEKKIVFGSCLGCVILYIHQKAASWIPSQGRYLGCGFDPWSGCVQEVTAECFCLTSIFFSLSFTLPVSLKPVKKEKESPWVKIKKSVFDLLQLGCIYTLNLVELFENVFSCISNEGKIWSLFNLSS